MTLFQGKAAFQGIAIGQIVELKQKNKQVRRTRIEDTDGELERFEAAKEQSIESLGVLYERAIIEVGETNAAIFEVHQMMLEDDDYLDSIRNIIESQKVNAEYAVATTGDNFATMFAAMDDEYMQARAADIRDISERLIQMLSGVEEAKEEITVPSIIVADDLAPSETIQLDKNKVLAFVTRQGTTNSHTAILARTMNIPALVSTPIPTSVHGKMAIVDGAEGIVIIEPTEEELAKYAAKKQEEANKRALLQKYKGVKAVTKGGKEIKLYANIGSVGDVAAVLQNDADGIGLFRSEFLYLQTSDYPTEEEQVQVYKAVAEMMAGKNVIIRTLDIGADKQIDYFNLAKEENPALGYRAIRICLTREEIFKTQLRAIYRASAFGKISIMIPMIISEWEIIKVKEIIEEVKASLDADGIPYGKVDFGIMIETPASVVLADAFAKHVDFFSIGTNDLTQYTLALDRQNPELDMFYDAHHPAILGMIQMVIDSAHRNGIWAGICGELGADTTLTEKFIEMGIDELSVSASMILPVKEKIINY